MKLSNKLFLLRRRFCLRWIDVRDVATPKASARMNEHILMDMFACYLPHLSEERQNACVEEYRKLCQEKATLTSDRDFRWFTITSTLLTLQRSVL